MKLEQSTRADEKRSHEVDPNEGKVEAPSKAAAGSAEGNAHLVIVDLETGGLEVERPILQIAAIAVDRQLDELDTFEVKIRFDEKAACPDALRRVHYRRAEWKRSAVSPKKAAWAFARFLRRHASVEVLREDLTTFRVAQLASHNSEFDGPFLTAWFDRTGVFLPASYRVFCTLQRAYWLFHEHPQLPVPDDFRLGTLCEYFRVPLNKADAHEAMADARAALAVYRAIVEKDHNLVLSAAGGLDRSDSVGTRCG